MVRGIPAIVEKIALTKLPPDLIVFDEVPHDELVPYSGRGTIVAGGKIARYYVPYRIYSTKFGLAKFFRYARVHFA